MKGRMSKKWGQAQQKRYSSNPTTANKKCYNKSSWAKGTIKSLITFSLDLWNWRCTILHGQENIDKNTKKKDKLKLQIQRHYAHKELIDASQQHIFQEPVDQLCPTKLLHYLQTWIHSFHIAQKYTKTKNGRDYQLVKLMQELTLDTDNRTKEKHKGKGRKKRYKQQGRTPNNPNPIKYLSQYSRRLITFRETQKEGSNITRTKNNSRPPAKPPYSTRPITF